jgi:aspartyl-tRNA(Asn)/glutamyl-tRNA(Gln) amidotransferase subunit C
LPGAEAVELRYNRAMITREEVERVARLAKLSLEPVELQQMQQELAAILSYVDRLNELDTQNVEPTAHVLIDALPLRDDIVQSGLARELALSQNPGSSEEGFAVPAFVEE